ncbi:uncharacterized protein LOC108665237 isoform X2 [Hyalella azteca]|uniref:Uncharacterized protein LOC108665237 isoform X2 n=1 Tax=Hyalella azteca TaxID=294128 RepID=A0A979FPD7_HYAAZ|nr:uncharacterized protein LOC108665237 isoform X2 [Hyalella azteca]
MATMITNPEAPREAATMSLAEVPSDQFDAFAAGLVEFLPHSYQIEAMLRGHLKYNFFTIYDVKLYAPVDAVHRHHMAVITPTGTAELKSLSIFWDENKLSDDDVYNLLRTLPVDSWDHPYTIQQIPLHLQPKMDAIMRRLTKGRSHLLTPIPIITMTLAPEDAPPVPQLPEGYFFGELAASYSEEILSRWVGASSENVEVFSKLLVTFPSVAIYYRVQRRTKLIRCR